MLAYFDMKVIFTSQLIGPLLCCVFVQFFLLCMLFHFLFRDFLIQSLHVQKVVMIFFKNGLSPYKYKTTVHTYTFLSVLHSNEVKIINLRFVGQSSGVQRNRVLNDPVMAIFPAKVVTTDASSILLSPPRVQHQEIHVGLSKY